MDTDSLKKFLGEVDAAVQAGAIEHEALRPTLEDLTLVLAELEHKALDPQARRDWEVTRDELIAEARRLCRRLTAEGHRP